ncbi:polysaccharide lyase family 4 protein [Schizophyllum commune Tattone D]|nr:polysaccharide lyase family 4 protein [Schizophyllum commune Tattone D]
MVRSFLLGLVYAAVFALSVRAFGLTESGNNYVVDTSGGLVFTVDKTSGDITSMKFNGIEAQDSSKHSHIASGIGASCSWTRTGHNDNYIKITCTASGIVQYYVAKYNDPSIHMATYTSSEPSVGELRFIARLKKSALPNGYAVSEMEGGTAIEGSDVFLVNGQTRSKFYSSRQHIDDQVHGVTGSNIGAFMIIPGTGYEGSSGGPFFRDINNQGATQQELYFYMNSGHTQTESYRMGLHGPYALTFTTGSTPSGDLDTSFWEQIGDVQGLVTQAQRGRVTGKASGYASGQAEYIVIGFANSDAQYWVRARSSDGRFTSPYMKPGTYTMTLYEVELAVASQSVTVSAGGLATSNIASTIARPSAIWQIGEYDGTPRGFLNAEFVVFPSDNRMHDWVRDYTVSTNNIYYFPMALFKDVGATTIRFSLQSGQGGARTLEIATTLAFAGGRPTVQVNDWSGKAPSAPNQPDSRGVTRGTWRGNNILYSYAIPDGVLHTGNTQNTITINVISGSSGSQFLSPNFVFDMVRLY